MSAHSDPPAPGKLPGLSYRDAGVDIDAMDVALKEIRKLAGATRIDGVLSEIGSFGGLFQVPGGGKGVLVSSVDGVGTKLRVAQEAGRHDTIGVDLVNHCINDILVQGARPLFFMDYIATGRLEPQVIVDVVRGLAAACREAGCALLGGETAEMPGFYRDGDYDVAGFIVGVAGPDDLITGEAIRAGDRLLGLESSGLHTNGYSLARKIIFERRGLGVKDPLPGTETTIGDALLAPHRSYLPAIGPLLGRGLIRGLSHITGGGFTDNVPRILPQGTQAVIRPGSWPVPALFQRLQEWGGVQDGEMRRAFNLGIGMVLVLSAGDEAAVRGELEAQGERVHAIGEIRAGSGPVIYEDAGRG